MKKQIKIFLITIILTVTIAVIFVKWATNISNDEIKLRNDWNKQQTVYLFQYNKLLNLLISLRKNQTIDTYEFDDTFSFFIKEKEKLEEINREHIKICQKFPNHIIIGNRDDLKIIYIKSNDVEIAP